MRTSIHVAVVVSLFVTHVDAAPPAPAASYFLGGNPHVPLAVVKGSAIASAVRPDERGKTCGPRARWTKARSRWRAVDAWGAVVGTYAVRTSERYDVTGCYEVTFDAAPSHDGTLLFVSEDSPWTTPRSAEWSPSAHERATFDSLRAGLAHGQSQGDLPTALTEVRADARFFVVPNATGGTTRTAVGGRCGGWLVASLVNGSWTVVSQDRSGTPAQRVCSRPLAVFDMNGDGTPEIVLRFIEGDGEWWGESVLQRSGAGQWSEVALSPGGSTA